MYEPIHGTRYTADSTQAETARARVALLAEDPAERAKALENDKAAR